MQSEILVTSLGKYLTEISLGCVALLRYGSSECVLGLHGCDILVSKHAETLIFGPIL